MTAAPVTAGMCFDLAGRPLCLWLVRTHAVAVGGGGGQYGTLGGMVLLSRLGLWAMVRLVLVLSLPG